jgi:uroporphyrinogen III methyltransferase/synthase
LPDELRARGATVDVVPLYETVLPREPAPVERVRDADMITFTSASTVENFARLVGNEATGLLGRLPVAAIGPITEQALERLGVTADIVADPYTIEALTAAIVRYFANRDARK